MHLCSCYEKRNLNLHGLINKNFFPQIFYLKISFLVNSNNFTRVQKNYFFEFGKITEFFRVQVRVRSSGGIYCLHFELLACTIFLSYVSKLLATLLLNLLIYLHYQFVAQTFQN